MSIAYYRTDMDGDEEPVRARTPKGLAKKGVKMRWCGKMPYASVTEAYAVAAKINLRCHKKYKVRAYRCSHCHKYHLARKKDRQDRKVGWVNP